MFFTFARKLKTPSGPFRTSHYETPLNVCAMYHSAEQKAATRRHSALILAIGLHIALAAALYFTSVPKTVNNQLTSPGKLEKSHPTPQAKAVNLP